ncbi:hypothetical protein EJ131_17550 [Bacillus mycoides]|nr:hypothetical protein [Bacillus mycoides]
MWTSYCFYSLQIKGLIYPAISGQVGLPPQNSAGAKKLGGRSTARKSPIGSTNNQWGMDKTPTD